MTSKTLITSEAIDHRVHELAKDITSAYQSKNVLLVGILKGSFIFLADLSKALWRAGLQDFEVDFMGISSYGADTESSRNPQITKDLATNIEHRHIIIVEDIIDTGYSLDALIRILAERQPQSIKSAVLLSKPSRREIQVHVDYIGFEVKGWIEGYGLDTNESGRGRPDVIVVHPDK
jgi:hypoxanthine phosphoribosyltransferase